MLGLDQQAPERRSLAQNEVLFRQGDKVTAIYFIEAGRLRHPKESSIAGDLE
jgi:CRP-like cAMP-binding protein